MAQCTKAPLIFQLHMHQIKFDRMMCNVIPSVVCVSVSHMRAYARTSRKRLKVFTKFYHKLAAYCLGPFTKRN